MEQIGHSSTKTLKKTAESRVKPTDGFTQLTIQFEPSDINPTMSQQTRLPFSHNENSNCTSTVNPIIDIKGKILPNRELFALNGDDFRAAINNLKNTKLEEVEELLAYLYKNYHTYPKAPIFYDIVLSALESKGYGDYKIGSIIGNNLN